MKVAVRSSINVVNSGKENDVAQGYVFQTWVFESTALDQVQVTKNLSWALRVHW